MDYLDNHVRIYYQESIYDGPVRDIPSPVGIVCLVYPDARGSPYETGRAVLHTCEYYAFEDGDWFRLSDIADLVDHVIFKRPDVILKGRWIPDVEYETILRDAMYYVRKDMPPKSMKRIEREGRTRMV